MAHKGRQYKVWFRRDASWAINNYNEAMPEAYECTFHSLIFSSRYAVSQFHTVLGINLHKDFEREWRSPTVGGTLDNCYWILRWDTPPNEIITEVKFSLWHAAVIDTPLFSATYFVFTTLADYQNVLIRALKTLHFLSPDITVDPDGFKATFQAARYSRYNP